MKRLLPGTTFHRSLPLWPAYPTTCPSPCSARPSACTPTSRTSPNTRSNVSFIAPALWASSGQEARHEIGLKHAVFSANGEIARKKLASDFLQRVEGLSYLPPDTLAVEVKNALDGLWSAHNGYNNFHNEPAFARFLRAYVPETGIVPPSVEVQYTKSTLLMCKIGNGYGVSCQAEPFYDDLLGIAWTGITRRSFVYLISSRSGTCSLGSNSAPAEGESSELGRGGCLRGTTNGLVRRGACGSSPSSATRRSRHDLADR